jgi:hypothetical protein
MTLWSRRDLVKTLPFASLAAAQSAGIPTLDSNPQLFVDYDHVESVDNITRAFHSAEKHPSNPVIRKEHPWEQARGTWGSVIYDEQEHIFKAWYGGTSGRDVSGCAGPNCRSNSVLCYATSTDGVTWDRPKLRLHEAAGTRDNNVIIGDDYRNGMAHWESVLKDPLDPNPQRRYKALGWSSFDWDGPQSGIFTMTSPDGLRWTHTPDPVFRFHPRPGTNDLGPIGDAQAMMIDTLRRRYVAYLRRTPNRVMSVSTDFVNWTPPRVCLAAEDGELSNTLYNHVGFVYGDRYLAFMTYFVRDKKDPRLTVRLLTSRDGDIWRRTPAVQPLIPNGDIGEVDRFTNLLTGCPPILRNGKLYIYYRALANRHNPYEGNDSSLEGGGLCLATLRQDGFASVAAGYDGGILTTKPFALKGTQLRVNAKANFGQLTAELLDEARNPIPGFTKQDCQPMRSDALDHALVWKNQPLPTKPTRLRFHLNNARLYAFRLAQT